MGDCGTVNDMNKTRTRNRARCKENLFARSRGTGIQFRSSAKDLPRNNRFKAVVG